MVTKGIVGQQSLGFVISLSVPMYVPTVMCSLQQGAKQIRLPDLGYKPLEL